MVDKVIVDKNTGTVFIIDFKNIKRNKEELTRLTEYATTYNIWLLKEATNIRVPDLETLLKIDPSTFTELLGKIKAEFGEVDTCRIVRTNSGIFFMLDLLTFKCSPLVAGEKLPTLLIGDKIETDSGSKDEKITDAEVDDLCTYLLNKYAGLSATDHQWTDNKVVMEEGLDLDEFQKLGLEIGSIVSKKNKLYGDSASRSEAILKVLFPKGVPVEKYGDIAIVIRVMDKIMRMCHGEGDSEFPAMDAAGYMLLSELNFRNKKKRNNDAQDEIERAAEEDAYNDQIYEYEENCREARKLL